MALSLSGKGLSTSLARLLPNNGLAVELDLSL